MSARAFLNQLPELEREGLITADQAQRIRARYAPDADAGSNRMLVVLAILGSLLVGLGIILVVAHNWNDLARPVRTALAILPVLIGQGLVWFGLQRKPDATAWREGSAVFLACALCACVALISQIYHIPGELDGYLFTCSLLILPLLYLPGSFIVALVYLAFITWYGALVRFEPWWGSGDDARPWWWIPLVLAAVPFYLRQAKHHGTTVGFWWLSLFAAITLGLGSQWFYTDWTVEHVLGMVALAGAFTLVPWLHPGRALRTWPWVLVGGATILITCFVFSFRSTWYDGDDIGWRTIGSDLPVVLLFVVGAAVCYGLSLARRKPFARWPYPEAPWLFLLCYFIGSASPGTAAIVMNLALLLMGILTVKQGTDADSLPRMNLGLLVLSTAILLRFFDEDMSFALRGLAFIGIGAAFLVMNLRMVNQRKRKQHAA